MAKPPSVRAKTGPEEKDNILWALGSEVRSREEGENFKTQSAPRSDDQHDYVNGRVTRLIWTSRIKATFIFSYADL